MANGWYYMRHGAKYGPFSSTQLVALAGAGQLVPTDLVWKEGMAAWKRAGDVKGVFSTPANAVTGTGSRPTSTPRRGWLLAGLVAGCCSLIFIVVLVLFFALPRHKRLAAKTDSTDAATPTPSQRQSEPIAHAVANVAETEKAARAQAVQLLPKIAELHVRTRKTQIDLTSLRKQPVHGKIGQLDSLLASSGDPRIDRESLGEKNNGYASLLRHNDLNPRRIGTLFQASKERQTVAQPKGRTVEGADRLEELIARRKELESLVRRAKDGKQVSKECEALCSDLLPRLTQPASDSMLQSWKDVRERYTTLAHALDEICGRVDRLRPTVPKELQGQLISVVAITHLIKGESYYAENKIVRIPDKYRTLFTHDRSEPNKVIVEGLFRFVENAKGKNALGATIPVEIYQCDDRYAEILLQQNRFDAEAKQFYAAFNSERDEGPLDSMMRTYRNLAGVDRFDRSIAEASKRAGVESETDWPPDVSKLRMLFEDDFKIPGGFPTQRGEGFASGYANGMYFIQVNRGTAGWHNKKQYSNFACRVVGRITGSAKAAWGVCLACPNDKNQGMSILISGMGEVRITPSPFVTDKNVKPSGPMPTRFEVDALEQGEEVNELIAVVRRRQVRLYVNGVAACSAIDLDRDIAPSVTFLVGASTDQKAKAEFDKITVWSLDGEP